MKNYLTVYVITRGKETVESFTNYLEAKIRCQILNDGYETDEFRVERIRLL